jgi:uncharacterized protein (DUF1800 family)
LFFGEGVVNDVALDELAAGLKEHELNVDWAVATILRSKLFFSAANLRTRILGPAEFVVGTLHALALCQPPASTLLLADWTGRMGQELFNPPNVGGWLEGRTWLGSRSIIARANFAAALVERRLWTTSVSVDHWAGVPPEVQKNADPAATVRFIAELLWGEVQSPVVEECARSIKDIEEPPARLAAVIYWCLTRPESQFG